MSNENRQRVVLDVMGADCAPENIIIGGIEASRRMGDKLQLVFVGREETIKPILASVSDCPANISIKHAATEVPMDVSAIDGVRMRDSSMAVGIKMIKQGEADAFVSPGNTGSVMANSLLTLGRIEGVSRPAIASLFPTSEGKPCVVLDVGANSDCKPLNLSQFAVMGSAYSSSVLNVDSPKVGVISIGEERSKGNELIRAARDALMKSKINFVGNIEGRDVLSGAVDVAVTDGFTGNILLKFAESVKPFMVEAVSHQVRTNLFSRFAVVLMLPFLKRMRSRFDYAESGGAPLLGVNGVIIICHGLSSPRAITNAIIVGYEMADRKINKHIHDDLVANHFRKENGEKDKSQDIRDGIVCTATGDDQR
ncbi:MAG: phosphate acyltransferase PlsX [Candidatus Zixiibacteriota bacterium]|nr:MAG: phosphate acyltransferase PlsX [candidate division Zixibacteria bacterium]